MSETSYICHYNAEKKYGFIQRPSQEKQLFFHVSDMDPSSNPVVGAFVEFEVIQDRRGPKASRVRSVEDSPEKRRSWALGKPGRKRNQAENLRAKLNGAILELEELVSWNDIDRTARARKRLLKLDFGSEALADLCVENGRRQQKDFSDYDLRIKRNGPDGTAVAETRTRLENDYPHLIHKIAKITESAAGFYRRGRAQRRSSVRKGKVGHHIQQLQPSGKWRLYIDDTGDSFGRDRYAQPGREAGRLGRFAAVLVPDPTGLKPLPPGTHFAELDIEKRDAFFQHLLDTPVGIFGITVDDLPETRGDRWVDGAILVVNWVLRLLPIDGPTEVIVLVEQRGAYSAGGSDWDALSRQVLATLAETHSSRYKKVKATIEIAEKSDSPYLQYADAVAHTWGSSALDAKTRRQASGLVGVCLHQGDGRGLMSAWDILQRGQDLSGEEWQDLIHDPDAGEPLGVAQTLLDQVAASCRNEPELWARYLEAAQAHLESKAIDLTQLGKEVAWLKSCKPDDTALSPLLELAWLTAELEHRNHRGRIDEDLVRKIELIGDEVYSEAPALVCQADLVRAVLATNQLQFDEASRALKRWEGKEMAVAGRRHWARIHSSLGQHASFAGDHERAEDLFVQAISAFGGLADQAEAEREISQTAAYRAIAAIDNPALDGEAIRERVAAVVSLDFESIRSIAASNAPEKKYAHHLLLRFLAQHGSTEECHAYLESRDAWQYEEGHPWPLIQGYRGMLLRTTDSAGASEYMAHGHQLAVAEGQGPTVRFIGSVLGAIAMGWGYQALVSEQDLMTLMEALPAGRERINLIHQSLENPLDPPERLLAEVLPFNFR